MRILQISPYFYPYIGGQERYVRCLGRALVNRGHEVEVYTSRTHVFPRANEGEAFEGMRISRFASLCSPLNNPILPMSLFRLMRKCRNFDVVHCHNEHAAASLYGALATSRSKVPLVLTCHGQLRFNHPVKDLIERAYSRTLGAKLLRKADRVITISDSDRSYVYSLGVPLKKITVIPNGIDLAKYDYQVNDPPKELVFEGKHVILFVGPVLKRKGPHVLIQAIPSIVKEHPDAVFVFAGGGSFIGELEKLSRGLHVENYTCFTGYRPEDQLHYLYKHSDVFVLPSFSEALSYTILDAFAFSKPVVSTLIPCIKDYLDGSAMLVPPGDHNAVAKAVVCLLNDEKLAKELGEKGRELVEKRFQWDAVVDKVLTVYQEEVN